MNTINRVFRNQPDYLLMIVRPEASWRPTDAEDRPPQGDVVSTGVVASFDEARDDLLRCNTAALERGYRLWAVIHSAGSDI